MVRIAIPFAAIAATALSTSASASSSANTQVNLAGVAPQDASLYVPRQSKDNELRWTCLDGSAEIKWSAVNDDYCDCPDGSDEPGTSACPNSTFYCANKGHIPSRIRSSRVNDGICDPECCDGSDETDGKVQCPDICAKVGKEYNKRMTELENIRRAGSKIRDKYISDGRKEMESIENEIARLQVELQVATEKESRLKRDLQVAETMDKAVIEAKMKTPLYETLSSHQQALKALVAKNSELKEEIKTLTLLLDDLARGYNPNYQDMAVKGAVVAYKEWRGIAPPTLDDAEKPADGLETENQKLKVLFDDGEWDSTTILGMAQENVLELMDGGLGGQVDVNDSGSDGGLLFRIHEYLPDAVVPYFEAMVDTLLDVLIKANLIKDVNRMRPRDTASGSGSEPENVTAARRAYNAAQDHMQRTRNDLTSHQTKLGQFGSKFGRDLEFKALEGKCFQKDMGEYTYEFCFFGRAKQIPNNGGAQVTLGSFSNWNPSGQANESQDAFWMQQMYANGQKCWNGPQRSAIVDFVCDTSNAVLDVFEAEKCIYSMKVSTPAVCFPKPAAAAPQEQNQHVVKDEL